MVSGGGADAVHLVKVEVLLVLLRGVPGSSVPGGMNQKLKTTEYLSNDFKNP